jgi:hypothetical protein
MTLFENGDVECGSYDLLEQEGRLRRIRASKIPDATPANLVHQSCRFLYEHRDFLYMGH